MDSRFLHPATLLLLKYQAASRCSKTLQGFRGGRRVVLSVLGLILALVWLGQTIVAVLLREPADLDNLRSWVPLGMLAYSLWHLVKAACQTPIEPFEWTEAEREILGGSPLRRRDLVLYRVGSIGTAAVAKAACFGLVMLPDLRVWPAGVVGMFLALMFIDLVRMILQIFAYGVSRRDYLRFRFAVWTVAVGAMISALVTTGYSAHVAPSGPLAELLGVGWQFLVALADLRTTVVGVIAESPFRVFASTILAENVSAKLFLNLSLALFMVVAMIKAVVWVDHYFLLQRHDAQRRAFSQIALASNNVATAPNCDTANWLPWRLKGAGTLAWRQLLGAYHYRTSILVSLLFPAILTCITLLSAKPTAIMLIHVVSSLVFYTFLLLPTALKFDFRRDTDRLAVLKSLPVSPTAIAIGQLAVPILISTVFQAGVLLVVMAIHPFHPGLLLTAMLVLVPVNILVFAFENLVFLLYPYRPGQEGIAVFLRTILTFTAKGLLFAVGFAGTRIWSMAAQRISGAIVAEGSGTTLAIVFAAGMWLAIGAISLVLFSLLTRVYDRFDPSQDTPAMS